MSATTLEQVVRHVGEQDLPWVDATGGIELKLLRVSLDTGVWVVRNRFQPGVQLQIHRHTGAVEGFTISGRWRYLEYDFVNTPGSYIHEPAGSVHTLSVPADNTEPTDVLFVIEGALLNLDAAGQVESVSDGPNVLAAYEMLCQAQGLPKPTGVLR